MTAFSARQKKIIDVVPRCARAALRIFATAKLVSAYQFSYKAMSVIFAPEANKSLQAEI